MPKAARRKAKAALPRHAPKRTGKRGIGPVPESSEEAPKTPRQARLPEMQDPAIEELEAKAEEYSSIRDQRMALTPEESRLKTELLGLMKKHNKTSYVHDGYDIKVIVESGKVRVKIKKED